MWGNVLEKKKKEISMSRIILSKYLYVGRFNLQFLDFFFFIQVLSSFYLTK